MSKRSELKENVLATKVEAGLKWILERQVQSLTILGIIIGGLLISSVFVLRSKEQQEVRWTRLAQAQSFLEQNLFSQSKQILTDINQQNPQDEIGVFSSYYLGTLELKQNNYDQATPHFSQVVQNGFDMPVRPLALSSLGFAYERQKDFVQAANTYQLFMDDYADHFLAPRVQLALGRSQAQSGQVELASQSLGQLVDLYPTSPWAQNARRILDKIQSR